MGTESARTGTDGDGVCHNEDDWGRSFKFDNGVGMGSELDPASFSSMQYDLSPMAQLVARMAYVHSTSRIFLL